MFTGALAASHYGTPRTTMDVDVIIRATSENMQTDLVSALKKAGLRVNEHKIKAALKSDYRIATIKDGKSPLAVDIILSDEKLDKKAGSILGLPTFYQTPEDLILAKLRMIKVTVSKEKASKDKEDIKAILRFTKVNLAAIKRQARENSTLLILEAVVTDKTRRKKEAS
jgi:hypothetical protein